ncbi:hypothetical protein PN36_33965 [Candidatus Thiomargarita nelsonii]|uniref:Uncharacterized protein n=1 Tax=Candidatus Thiomargarita nelsonii TaxID=1003181 RepID=A0A4E0QWD5_9GAMM|nr:hypothetical protein PN36_33965 [Candidatus Thiomargarita nelsonii]
MNTLQSVDILQTLDRLIGEMNSLRSQVAALDISSTQTSRSSVRQSEYFGMWAQRDDMSEESSREWLEKWRSQQWSRSI